MKPTLYAFVIVAALVACMWSRAAELNQQAESNRTVDALLTNEIVSDIRHGMTLDEVVDVIGFQPTRKSTYHGKLSSSERSAVYFWDALDTTLVVKLQNGGVYDFFSGKHYIDLK